MSKASATAQLTDADDGFAFITGNGNIIQIEILSDNVIAPQFAVGGDNNLVSPPPATMPTAAATAPSPT